VKPSSVRTAARIPSQVIETRLRDAIVTAMLTVSTELATWRAAKELEGFATLAAVSPDDTIGGRPRLVVLYERAIASFTAAELADTHRDISASADGQKRAEDEALTADEHRRNGTHAIRDILGMTRTSVELI